MTGSHIPQIDNLGDITTDAGRLFQRINALLAARNAANDAQQRFNDSWPSVDGRDEISDALYEATYELVNRIDNLVTSVEWQNMMLGMSNGRT